MAKTLNVSVVQMPIGTTKQNLKYLKDSIDGLMTGYIRPELVVGVEFGISFEPRPLINPNTEFLSALARKHHIYLIPGTMAESHPSLPNGQYFNTCPVFGPDGSMIAVYRKRTPYWPEEPSAPGPNEGGCLINIPKKNIKLGLMICYEQFFPEIPRALAMEGAELMICPSLDNVEFSHVPDILPRARALENEAYYIWTCAAGPGSHGTYCGRSIFVGPEVEILHQCGSTPEIVTKTLDLERVWEKRCIGADQHLSSLKRFGICNPYDGHWEDAPVYRSMQPLTETPQQYEQRLKERNQHTFSGGMNDSENFVKMEETMENLLNTL